MARPASIPPAEDRGLPPAWSKWAAATWPPGWTVLHVDETGSTNDDLLNAARAMQIPPRTALVAAHQTAGRGRLDRRWDAPPGSNLLVTLFLGSMAPGLTPATLMQRVGVAIVDGVEHLVGGRVDELGLKWPNDVMFADRKLAGVLAQARSGTDGLVMVVGCGVNVGWAPDGAASVQVDVTGGSEIGCAEMLASMLAAFDRSGDGDRDRDRAGDGDGDGDRDGDGGHAERYRSRLLTLGRRVRVELPGDRECVGRATAVGDDGRLEVTDPAGTTHRFDVGDVVHLRPEPR